MAIKILKKGLPVVGYAKIGEPGQPRQDGRQAPPVKFDHFEVTGRERDEAGRLLPDAKLMARLIEESDVPTCGGCARSEILAKQSGIAILKQGLPRRLPIVLPYNDIDLVLPNRLALYRNKTAFCTGDGIEAMRLEEKTEKGQVRFGKPVPYGPCGPTCADFQSRKCKPHGKLRFILGAQENVGGCFEFQSTSWNSLSNLTESLEFIQTITGGVLAWIPLYLEVSPQTVQPQDGGPSSTAFIARVTFPGSPQLLLSAVTEQLQLRAPMIAQIRQLEASIRGEVQWTETSEEIDAIAAEFVPEAAGQVAGKVIEADAETERAVDDKPAEQAADPFADRPSDHTKPAAKAARQSTTAQPSLIPPNQASADPFGDLLEGI